MRCLRKGLLVTCLIGVCCANILRAQTTPEIGWIGLYEPALVAWLENENRLATLCADAPVGSPARTACHDRWLRPMRRELSLRHHPDPTARPAGTLVLEAVPGRGLAARYRSLPDGRETAFVPDLFDVDWGYGPWFHQTFLERRGTWFLLPADPFPVPLWMDAGDLSASPELRLLAVGDILSMDGEDWVVSAIGEDAVHLRSEQAADMWCEPGAPPPLQPAVQRRWSLASLHDARGHLLPDIKYKRGC